MSKKWTPQKGGRRYRKELLLKKNKKRLVRAVNNSCSWTSLEIVDPPSSVNSLLQVSSFRKHVCSCFENTAPYYMTRGFVRLFTFSMSWFLFFLSRNFFNLDCGSSCLRGGESLCGFYPWSLCDARSTGTRHRCCTKISCFCWFAGPEMYNLWSFQQEKQD